MPAEYHRPIQFDLRLGSVKTLLVGWAVAECLTLILVIKLAGFGGAVLLSIVSSLLGVLILRRLGLGAARHLRATMAGGAPPEGALLDGMLAAVGALLLILPGFVSDLVGLALAAPSTRLFIAARLGGSVESSAGRRTRTGAPDVIDLSPADWTVVERPGQR